MDNHERDRLRQQYYTAWQKYLQDLPMTALEADIADIIAMHPEYHEIFDNEELSQQVEYFPELGESNPYLHMGLHLALREQVKTDRPAGINLIYQDLIEKHGSIHDAEHAMQEHLAEAMWSAQQNDEIPDEEKYLESLKALL
tara:strand:+ start:41249 stop:41674 length:426 start_codon:yes stop_codon:yes gene_type:complete